MTSTRIRALLGLGAFCAALTWLLLIRLYARLPPLPWTPSLTVLLLALVEARAGRLLRARIAGQRGLRGGVDGFSPDGAGGPAGPGRRAKPLDPIGVARTAAIGKASAQAAAVIAGIAVGFVLDLLHLLSAPTPRDDTFAALGILASAVILAVAAIYLERSCRVPPVAGGDGHPG